MSKKNVITFLGIILLISFLYEYHEIIFMLPQSVHDWRQADCASFAMVYYENGMHLFEPKVYNVLMGGGNCVGECPVIYYFVACLYKLFGPHEVIFRLVNVLIFYSGLVALLHITYHFLADKFYSFYVPVLLFSSPLIMFFANNYLCDVPSLSCVLIAWSFILKYRNSQKNVHFWCSMLFFALAGLLKANALISFVALGAMFFLELNNWINLRPQGKMFGNLKITIAGFVMVVLVVGGWYMWAIHYNASYSVQFLGTKSWPGWPIWQASPADLLSTVTMLFFHAMHIFHLVTCALILFLLFFIHSNRASLDKLLYGVLILSLAGAFAFLMLFFVGLRDNIYYFVNLMIIPVIVFISSLSIMRTKYNVIYNSYVFKGLLLVFLLVNVMYAKAKQNVYYHEGVMHNHNNKNLYDPAFKPFLDSIGIAKNDLVISMSDVTPDVTLYLIGRQGWSNYNIQHDTASINRCIGYGAKYLILNDPTLLGDKDLANYTGDFVANFNTVYVYRLGTKKQRPGHVNTPAVIHLTPIAFIGMDNAETRGLQVTSDTLQAKKFFVYPIGADKVVIKTEDGKFLSCNMNDGAKITASTGWIADWEQFKLVKQPDGNYGIMAVNGKYLTVRTSPFITATAGTVGRDETFFFTY